MIHSELSPSALALFKRHIELGRTVDLEVNRPLYEELAGAGLMVVGNSFAGGLNSICSVTKEGFERKAEYLACAKKARDWMPRAAETQVNAHRGRNCCHVQVNASLARSLPHSRPLQPSRLVGDRQLRLGCPLDCLGMIAASTQLLILMSDDAIDPVPQAHSEPDPTRLKAARRGSPASDAGQRGFLRRRGKRRSAAVDIERLAAFGRENFRDRGSSSHHGRLDPPSRFLGRRSRLYRDRLRCCGLLGLLLFLFL